MGKDTYSLFEDLSLLDVAEKLFLEQADLNKRKRECANQMWSSCKPEDINNALNVIENEGHQYCRTRAQQLKAKIDGGNELELEE